jgi:precorrin-6B methylase 2
MYDEVLMFFGKRKMSYREFLENIPSIHTWDDGKTWNTGGFHREHLEPLGKLFETLPSNSIFLETGAGCSTIAMLLTGKGQVISIAPDEGLYGRIVKYCESNGISTQHLEAHVARSEWELPKLTAGKEPFVDFALIDGCHGWPTAFVDLQYMNAVLKRGGYLMIDDLNLHSIKEMDRFLYEQPGFELALDIGKSHVYKKTNDESGFGDWFGQPFIVRKFKEYEAWENPFAR